MSEEQEILAPPGGEEEEDDDENLEAFLQRNYSERRRSKWGRHSPRRGSSPFLPPGDGGRPGRRRPSTFTVSSGDETAVSVEEELTQEELMENIRLHKEAIENIKFQPWRMKKKYKALRKAKLYVNKHEGELAQSKRSKDIFTKYKILYERGMNRFKKELANLIVILTPWEMRIKRIESHFGSAVASYFTFLRWVFWVNLFITIFLSCFLIVPEVLRGDNDQTGMRKEIEGEEDREEALDFMQIWDFQGYLKFSPLFYGYYSNKMMTEEGYRLPLAYFLTSLCVYIFSFFIILKRMAENARQSKQSDKEDECIFTWKLFTGWDYMIGNSETAHNKKSALLMSFKESILEETERVKEQRNWKLIVLRIFTNLIVLALLASSAYGIQLLVERSMEPGVEKDIYRAYELQLAMAGLSIVLPNMFDMIGGLERYHPRIQLRWQLSRILFLNLLNLYSLIFSMFRKIYKMSQELELIKTNITETLDMEDHAIYLNLTFAQYPGASPPSMSFTRAENCTRVAFNNCTEDMYEALFWRIANFTAHGVANWTYPVLQSPGNLTSLLELMTPPPIAKDASIGGNATEDSPISENCTFYVYVCATPDDGGDSTGGPSDWLTTTTTTMSPAELETATGDIDNSTTTTAIYPLDITTTTQRPEPTTRCIVEDNLPRRTGPPSSTDLRRIDRDLQEKLKTLCWETMFGQEMVKMNVVDLLMTIASTLGQDFLRALFVRYSNRCCCWNIEQRLPGYGDFKIAENILHLVNNQGMVWLGMFFAPALPAINTIKLCVLLYLRSWAVLTCNIPHETVFKASRSNNFYYALLLTMLFVCTLPVGFMTVRLNPSWHCGPFSDFTHIYKVFTSYVESKLPPILNNVLDYVTSPGMVIPFILLLVLIIYYLTAVAGSLRESNNDLKVQLRRERDQEKMKRQSGEEGEPVKANGHVQQEEVTKWSTAKKIVPAAAKFKPTTNHVQEEEEVVPVEQTDTEEQVDTKTKKPLPRAVELLRAHGEQRRRLTLEDLPVITVSQPLNKPPEEGEPDLQEVLKGSEQTYISFGPSPSPEEDQSPALPIPEEALPKPEKKSWWRRSKKPKKEEETEKKATIQRLDTDSL